ncbi:MAG TPA: hypothetical protein ENK07_05300 [Bacteroidetes bacterium]|nr:hypothetical protein [Bacteroidota bacterium]
MRFRPPRHIVWSTDTIDLDDPFQRRWYIRQVLLHGRAEDVSKLDFAEVAAILDELHLPPEVDSLWRKYLTEKGYAVGKRGSEGNPAKGD